jgi:hypothetical protein
MLSVLFSFVNVFLSLYWFSIRFINCSVIFLVLDVYNYELMNARAVDLIFIVLYLAFIIED